MTPATTPDTCTNDNVTNAIYIDLLKAGLASPLKQINVTWDAGVVTLTGFVNNSAEKATVVGIAEHPTSYSSCVTRPVNVEHFSDCAPGPPVQPESVGGGCGSWFRCGDICVPDRCFWGPHPSASTTPSPVPASSAPTCAPSPTSTLSPKPTPTQESNTNKPTSTANTKY